jgi:hypothetical protein
MVSLEKLRSGGLLDYCEGYLLVSLAFDVIFLSKRVLNI